MRNVDKEVYHSKPVSQKNIENNSEEDLFPFKPHFVFICLFLILSQVVFLVKLCHIISILPIGQVSFQLLSLYMNNVTCWVMKGNKAMGVFASHRYLVTLDPVFH